MNKKEKECTCNEEVECENCQEERQEANDFWQDLITK